MKTSHTNSLPGDCIDQVNDSMQMHTTARTVSTGEAIESNESVLVGTHTLGKLLNI